MVSEDEDRDTSIPPVRIALATVGLLLTLLVIAAIVRPDMMMHVMNMVTHDARGMLGM